MTIQELCQAIRFTRSILVSPVELWAGSRVSPCLEKRMRRALRRHKQGLALLIDWSTIATCPSRDLHRQHYYWRNGAGRCQACEVLRQEVSA